MPFMALMPAPLSAMLSVTGGDGSLDYPSHTRARTADNLFWRHHVSPTRAGGWGAPHLGEPFNASIIAEIDTAFAPLASYRPKDLGSAVHGILGAWTRLKGQSDLILPDYMRGDKASAFHEAS